MLLMEFPDFLDSQSIQGQGRVGQGVSKPSRIHSACEEVQKVLRLRCIFQITDFVFSEVLDVIEFPSIEVGIEDSV